MRRFGIIGYPLSHSFSPTYFAQKFAKEGIIDCVYEAFPLTSIEELKHLITLYPDLEGLNVTIPYKKKVIRFLHEGNDAVKETVACNCLKIRNGKIYGYNTDIEGFRQSLVPLLKPNHDKALILGTGGASLAVEYVLKKLGIAYVFVSRDKVGKQNCISYRDVNESWLSVFKLIINTSPVGQYPEINEAPEIPYKYLGPHHLLYDLIYNPAETQFLKRGLEQGASIKNGAEMLHIQAEESWRIWNEK